MVECAGGFNLKEAVMLLWMSKREKAQREADEASCHRSLDRIERLMTLQTKLLVDICDEVLLPPELKERMDDLLGDWNGEA